MSLHEPEEFPSAPVWDAKDLTDDQIEAWVESNGGSSEVQVTYTVPVLVAVDLLTGQVTRVREVVQDITTTDPTEVHTMDYEPIDNKQIGELALYIAENALEWPAWEAKF